MWSVSYHYSFWHQRGQQLVVVLIGLHFGDFVVDFLMVSWGHRHSLLAGMSVSDEEYVSHPSRVFFLNNIIKVIIIIIIIISMINIIMLAVQLLQLCNENAIYLSIHIYLSIVHLALVSCSWHHKHYFLPVYVNQTMTSLDSKCHTHTLPKFIFYLYQFPYVSLGVAIVDSVFISVLKMYISTDYFTYLYFPHLNGFWGLSVVVVLAAEL